MPLSEEQQKIWRETGGSLRAVEVVDVLQSAKKGRVPWKKIEQLLHEEVIGHIKELLAGGMTPRDAVVKAIRERNDQARMDFDAQCATPFDSSRD